MKYNTICYKLDTPIIYNKGTKYETSKDEFLAYYTHLNDEEAQAEVDRLNREKPEFFHNGLPAPQNCTYFLHKQELFED